MRGVRASVIAALGLAASLASGQAALAGTSAAAAARQVSHPAGFHLPFTDPDQAGWLTLCGPDLKPVTRGSITSAPFVWRVVSSVPAPKDYFIKNAKAQMFAYQPRPYTPAGAWSGTVMGAATLYSNRKHPMAQFTPIDSPLTQMTLAFPPIWEHLIELRLYLGAPGLPEDTSGYAAADIQVTGKSWTLVAGGHGSCTAGRAVSIETVVGMPGAKGTPTPSASSSPGGGSGSASAAPSPGSSAAAAGSGGGGNGPAAAQQGPSRSAAGGAALAAVAAVVVVLAAAVSGGAWRRRRRRATG